MPRTAEQQRRARGRLAVAASGPAARLRSCTACLEARPPALNRAHAEGRVGALRPPPLADLKSRLRLPRPELVKPHGVSRRSVSEPEVPPPLQEASEDWKEQSPEFDSVHAHKRPPPSTESLAEKSRLSRVMEGTRLTRG